MLDSAKKFIRRPSFNGRIALMLTFALVTGAGLIAVNRKVDSVLTDSLQSSTEQGASATANTLADFALSERELEQSKLSSHAKRTLQEELNSSSAVESARLWDRSGNLVLDTEFDSKDAKPADEVPEAFDGESITRLTSRADEKTEGVVQRGTTADDDLNLIEVYLPMSAQGEAPKYVLEAFLPYKPAGGLIAGAHRSLNILLTGTTVLLWLMLVWLFFRASRRIVPPGRNFGMERRLRAALAAGQIVTVFQPKVDLRTGSQVGVEALVRWRKPKRGLVAPGEFLPQIESSPVMHALTRTVLDQALGQLAAWRRAGIAIRSMAVNIPSHSLLKEGFEGQVKDLLAYHRIPAAHLTLELTEASFIEQADLAQERVSSLRNLGVAVSIDDFGTRYSSLARLAGLDVSELKIDRAFVAGMRRNQADLAVVQMIIDLGEALGLRVVAEGIEEEEDAEELRRLGCTIGQGFLYARPMEWAQVAQWCGQHSPGYEPASNGNGRLLQPPVWRPGKLIAR